MPLIPGSGILSDLKNFIAAALAEERIRTDVKFEQIQAESLAVLENDRIVAAAAAVQIQQQIATAAATSAAALSEQAQTAAAATTQADVKLERILAMLAAPTATA